MAEIKDTTLAEQIVGKSVYDLMMCIDSIDCDIVSDDGDFTYPSLVEFGRNTLTEEGHKEWDGLLKEYIIESYESNGAMLRSMRPTRPIKRTTEIN